MGADWTRTSLGEVARLVSGGTPSKSEPSYWHGSTPWVSAKDMKRFRLFDTEDHVTDDGVANGTRLVPPGTTLLLTRGMTLLKNVPICVVGRPMTFNQDVKALLPRDGLVSNYLPYLLLGARQKLLALVDLAGHGTGRLNTDELRQLPIALPSPEEQRRIAAVLGAFDDKIELNRRMSETLENVARALFSEWFLGAQADGWPLVALGDFVLVTKGRSYRSAELRPSTVALVTLKSFQRGGGYRDGGLKAYTGPFKPEQRVLPGEIIVAVTDVTQAADVIGRPAIVQAPEMFDTLVVSLDTVVVRPRHGDRHRAFIYYLLLTESFTQHAVSHTTGTTVLHLKPAALLDYRFPKPADELLEAFHQLAGPLLRRQDQARAEIATLVSLRDALLPKLISGEVRIPDAERIVSEVT